MTANQGGRQAPAPNAWGGAEAGDEADRLTRLAQANAELQRGWDSYRLAAGIAQMFTWELDLDTMLFTRLPDPREVLDLDIPAEVEGMLGLVHPNDRGQLRRALDRSIASGEALDEEIRLVPPGRPPVWIRSVGMRQEGRFVGVTQDITARKQAEQRHAQVFAELQHRVKNILAVVRSISARTGETATSLDAYAAHFGGRLDALARTQSVLARCGAAGVELEDLIRDELAASVARDDEQVTVSGPRVLLKEKAVEVFAMALHELTTNAVKYGALSMPAGTVAIEWQLVDRGDSRALTFTWRERGVSALDSRPARIGFGRDLLERGLPYDLGAATTLRFAPGGVQFSMELPFGTRVVDGR